MKLDFLPYDLKLNHTWAIARSAVTGGGSDVASIVLGRLSNQNGAGLLSGSTRALADGSVQPGRNIW